MSAVLNPYLYDRLVKTFGTVIIAREGESMTGSWSMSSDKRTFNVADSGEYYRVNCPICHDTRHRLWINHRWGVGAPGVPGVSSDSLWWMLVCYNEECYEGKDAHFNKRSLEKKVYADTPRNMLSQLRIQPGIVYPELTVVEDPGPCTLLKDLPEDHEAVKYVRSRGFCPLQLSRDYHIKYCHSVYKPEHKTAEGRILAPIYMNENYVGWQARFVGEAANYKWTPKYYTMPRFHKGRALYDYDAASLMPLVVVVEGITDCWALGAGSVALLGKTLTPHQVAMVQSKWKHCVLLLDADAVDNSMDAYQKLRRQVNTIVVQLPEGKDPATMPDVWNYIFESAKQQGTDLQKLFS